LKRKLKECTSPRVFAFSECAFIVIVPRIRLSKSNYYVALREEVSERVVGRIKKQEMYALDVALCLFYRTHARRPLSISLSPGMLVE